MKENPHAPSGVTGLLQNPRPLLRAALIVATYFSGFIILDLISQRFEELKGIVAWYPPAGLTYTLLLIFGARFMPAVAIALFASSIFIYRMPQPPYLLFLWAFIISLIYCVGAVFLRQRIRFDWQLRKYRDVIWFIFTTVLISAVLAVLSVSSSALSGDLPRSEVLTAIFHWWIGETVGVLTVTPFLLSCVMPGLKRFTEGQPVRLPAIRSFPRPSLTFIGQAFSIAFTLYWVFGMHVLNEFQPMYLIILPLIWICLQRGFRGGTAGIAALNFGVIFAQWYFRFDLARLGELQLLMIINCIVGLLIGAVVAERKQAEVALKRGERRLRNVIIGTHAGTWEWNAQTGETSIDEESAAMLGYSLNEFQPNTFEKWIGLKHPEDVDETIELLDKHVKGETDYYSFESRMKHKDGHWVWILGRGKVVEWDKNGKPLWVFGTHMDITERKQGEEALLESEVKLKKAQRFARLGSWTWNIKTNQLDWSDEMFRLFGLEKEVFTGLLEDVIAQAIHPDDRLKVEKANLSVTQHQQSMPLEYRVVWPDQSVHVVWAEAGEMILDEAGSVAFLSGTVQDITERKRAEAALRKSDELYRSLFGNMLNGFAYCQMLFDAEDRPSDFIYLSVNKAFEALTGLKNVTGKKVTEVIPGIRESDQGLLEAYGRVSRTGEPERFEVFLESLQMWFSIAVYSPERGYFVSVFDVITERKQAEEKLALLNAELEKRVAERTAQLEAINRELETFNYSVSHDLKAPLRGIDGYSRMLQEDHAGSLNDEARTFLDNIRRATQQMNQLIEDLLSMSRLERHTLDQVAVDVRRLIDSILIEMEENLRKAGASVQVNLPYERLRGDATVIAQALRNLIDNAVKFSRKDTAPLVEIGGREDEKTWLLWVKDNGIGFDMAYKERIFEIFQRLQRVEEYPGTGIGLALVQKAMQRMGGRVWAESAPGEGATFYLEFKK